MEGTEEHPCKHIVACLLTLRNYLRLNAPPTWEAVLSKVLEDSASKRSTSLATQLLFFSLQKRYSSWSLFPYGLPVGHFSPEVRDDPQAIARIVRQEKLSGKVTAVRSLGNPRRFANLTDGSHAALQVLVAVGQYGYYYGGASNTGATLLPQIADNLVFQGSEASPLQKRLNVSRQPGTPTLELSETAEGMRLRALIALGDREPLAVDPQSTEVVFQEPLWLLSGSDLFGVDDAGGAFETFVKTPEINVPAAQQDLFLSSYLLPLAERIPLRGDLVSQEDVQADPLPRLYLSEEQGEMQAQLRFGYGDYELIYDRHRPPVSLQRKGGSLTLVRVHRQPDSEEQRWQQLASGFGLKRGPDPDLFALRARTDPLDFLLHQVPHLAEAGFEIYGEDALKTAKINRNRPTISFSVSSGIDWFDVQAVVNFGDTEVSLKELRKAVKKREKYVKLADGSIGAIPEEWLERYKHLFGLTEETDEGLRLGQGQITLLDQLLAEGDRIQADPEFERRRQRLRNFTKITPRPLPAGLTGEPRPYQKAGFDWLHFLHEYEFGGCLADDMGLGKAQPLDAKILTPTGWKLMGEMQVGDWVINSQGGTSCVTGVFPQGEKQIFRVTFSDGSHTECCDDHLWSVNTAVRNRRGNIRQVLPLSTIRERLRDAAGNCRHFVPIVKPIEFAEAALPLHPYLLGALLGDGGLAHRVIFSTADSEMVERVNRLLPPDVQMRRKDENSYDWRIVRTAKSGPNSVQAILRDLGLAGHRSEGKFIPGVYKFSAVGSRICLLQGLLDTDGYAGAGKNIEFTSVSPQLAADVRFLVQSLGGTATLRAKRTSGQLSYRLNITLPPGIAPFALSRKAVACPPRVKYHPSRAIVSVEPIGAKQAQCIAVDAPDHLYVTDGCIVTHNTLTTLAFLQSLKENGASKAATLIVLPRSLIFNWEREAAKWTPGLTLLNHAHTSRAKDLAEFDKYDLVLTTYGILLRDITILRQHRFHYVILDEAQAIKNPVSQTGKAARLLQADHRLTLTGTPVENSTLELWSQFAFLNPGLLGNLEYFRTEFSTAIEKHQDEATATFLRKMVHPFILRRTKDQVATDLPPRTERILYTEMEPAQRRLYDKKRDYYRAQVLGLIEEEGMDDARMKILEGLLRLRQISNHPRLAEAESKSSSGKFEMLLETLDTLRSEGHKALVFSQFVGMLKIVREALDARGIPYAYLDGSTKDREARVDAFQNDPNLPFFLISLKAGGVGLNLTAADYVIHIDPWWNPAVEMQATDRTHRIGQDKPVFVYKLIARDTVEEKILQLQDRKRALVSQLIATEGGFFKSLTRQDVEMLFE